MSLVLLAFSVLMFLAYAITQWRITTRISRGILRQETVTLPGKRVYYVVASGVSIFFGTTALYFAGVTYFGAPLQPVCWLLFALTPSLLFGSGTALSLRFATFEEHESLIKPEHRERGA